MISKIRLILALGLALAPARAGAAEKDKTPMPLTVHEALWESPGPEQSGPGAPKLLVVSPSRNAGPEDTSEMRYAGRVEPADAVVTLNGEPLRIYPGGVFAGLRSRNDELSETWRFEAMANGKKTVVERTLRRLPPDPPAPSWPLAFYKSPVRPTGNYWLRPGGTVKVTLYASPGRRAQARVGKDGAWQTMTAAGRDENRGGIYRIELKAPRAQETPVLQSVYFRISGAEAGQTESKELASALRMGVIPEGRQLWGRITANLGTFLKNGEASDWARWGNWIAGTPFPVLEGRGERLRTGFERGEAGWVENLAVTLEKTFRKRPLLLRNELPSLGPPEVSVARNALTLAWPAVKQPVACVFYHEKDGDGATLKVSLPGAYKLGKFNRKIGEGGFISASSEDARGKAPSITIKLSQSLWGYAMLCDAQQGLRVVARTQPPVGAPGKPLAGLRVMLDAGHGGPSLGAAGPSGLLEKDINLVQAAWLEKFLEAMGAEVRQVRRTDVDIDLDERVDIALAWNPDLFISLHHNSVGEETSPLSDTGPIVFYHYPHSERMSEAIAESLAARMNAEKGARSRSQVFRVNRNVSLCPSVLTETAYICNPFDEVKLRRAEELKATAEGIAQGVRRFFEER